MDGLVFQPSLVRLICKSPQGDGCRAKQVGSGGGDIYALAFEYLRISIKIIQPTKHIAKGDRNRGMRTLSWQLKPGLEMFQGRIKSGRSAGRGLDNRQRVGMAELGISAGRRRVWGCRK